MKNQTLKKALALKDWICLTEQTGESSGAMFSAIFCPQT
jgi:hypothetical protein